MLWILEDQFKPRTLEDIDKIVCAELPDPSDKELFDYVATHVFHGPCGSTNPRCLCMKDEKYSKKFPKEFVSSTQVNTDGYPLYQRCNCGRTIRKGLHLIDNPWVFSYNKYLCKVFNCHINVEICSSIHSVKYLHKYVYKGHNRIQARISSTDAPRDGAIAGATCYEVLRTVDGVVCDTYQKAVQERGLLHSDAEFDNDLTLVACIASPRQVRELFAMMLHYCDISQPDVLLEKYLDAMSEDIRFANYASQLTNPIWLENLSALESIIYHNGSSFATFPGLSQGVKLQLTETECGPSQGNNILCAILAAEHLQGMLNLEQRQLYDAVFEAIESTECAKEAKVFFVDGPRGYGKTFLYSAILAQIKASRLNSITTATSGIVTLLLEGGQMLHSTFKIPILVTHISTCAISPDSKIDRQIQSASMIIVDEALIMHRHVYKTLDRSIRDVMKNIDASLENVLFGGKVIVMGGDLRQMLLVIPIGSRSMIFSSSLNRNDKQISRYQDRDCGGAILYSLTRQFQEPSKPDDLDNRKRRTDLARRPSPEQIFSNVNQPATELEASVQSKEPASLGFDTNIVSADDHHRDKFQIDLMVVDDHPRDKFQIDLMVGICENRRCFVESHQPRWSLKLWRRIDTKMGKAEFVKTE
ncbi:uncharacterized protein LOC144707157 [Wolffia australiana]